MEKIIVGKTILKSQIEDIAGKITKEKYQKQLNSKRKSLSQWLWSWEIEQVKCLYSCDEKGATDLLDHSEIQGQQIEFLDGENEEISFKFPNFYVKAICEKSETKRPYRVKVQINKGVTIGFREYESLFKEAKQFQKDLEVILASYKSTSKLLEAFPELNQYIQVQVSSGAIVPMSVIQNVKEKLK